jgi:hypothetical protein
MQKPAQPCPKRNSPRLHLRYHPRHPVHSSFASCPFPYPLLPFRRQHRHSLDLHSHPHTRYLRSHYRSPCRPTRDLTSSASPPVPLARPDSAQGRDQEGPSWSLLLLPPPTAAAPQHLSTSSWHSSSSLSLVLSFRGPDLSWFVPRELR